MQVAASMKYENILINEWGIDEDGTNAEEVASCFYEILISEKYAEFFKNIIFNFENQYKTYHLSFKNLRKLFQLNNMKNITG